MYIIIWEYFLKPEHLAEFEEIYSQNGAWAKLFQKSKGFLKTELLRDAEHLHRYITIDQWRSSQDYEQFLSQWKNEYLTLDARCEKLTEKEALLAKGESVLRET